MKKVVALCLGLMLSGFVCGGESGTGLFIPMGKANKSCGVLLAADKKGNQQNDWRDYNEFVIYLSGYFTAYNKHVPNTVNILASTDWGGVWAYLVKHCSENPLHKVSQPLAALTKKLYPKRQITAY